MVAVIAIVFIIVYLKSNRNYDEEAIKCLASKSEIYISRTCSACAYQKQVLGEYYDLFDTVDCNYNFTVCEEANIPGFPTWIINGEQYPGARSIKELIKLAGC